ncbi:MAG: FAD-dependent monooxygenase [Myxococcales bacterium]|nr:FAD-dependent monooxygenase [Myxococcales bacterium]
MPQPTLRANVAIIGAGPSGTAAAARLAQLGVADVLLCDKADFPRDKTCGSGISPKGIQVLRDLGVWASVEPHSYPIRGIRLVTPGDRESWQSAGDKAAAVVCQRRVLDHELLKAALRGGVRFEPGVTATELAVEGGRTVGFRARDGRRFQARYTLVAGGTHCRLGAAARPRRMIQAIMGWFEGVPFRPHHVEMVFDRRLAPYYGWLFPEGPERVNIGITYEDPTLAQNARALFREFLDKHYRERLAGARQLGSFKGHPIAFSYRVGKLCAPGHMVLGEAGLMTHPATAEGIYQGMRSGVLAAEALGELEAGRATEAQAFARYERRCRQAFQLSFLGGGLFRSLVKTPLLDWLVRASEQPAVQSATARIMAAM